MKRVFIVGLLLLLATPALADEAFNQRQDACNKARDDLDTYVTRASGFTINQDSQYGRDGRLTAAETASLNHRYYLATNPLTWEIRDAAFDGDVARCRALMERGIARVNTILIRQFGKIDASISPRK